MKRPYPEEAEAHRGARSRLSQLGTLGLRRLNGFNHQARRFTEKPGVRRAAWIGALLLLAGGLITALWSAKIDPSQLDWRPLVWLLGAAIPASLLLGTLETMLAAEAVGRRFPPRRALAITLFASAANLLPVPGAAGVRVISLKDAGASMGHAGMTTLGFAVIWLGVALIFSASFAIAQAPWFATAVLAGGLAITGAGLAMFHRFSPSPAVGLKVAALKLVMILLTLLRVGLCLAAIGVASDLSALSVLAVSGIVGSAVAVVPGGLGVREATAAALAPLGGLPPDAVFIALAIDRAAGLSQRLVLAASLGAFSQNPNPSRG
ncbi:MAG: hypothetical protein GVY06_11225 [Alphaproteobacteria bacterium]|nr:hypothetical protein [Alphaproteobacteria bacterium]